MSIVFCIVSARDAVAKAAALDRIRELEDSRGYTSVASVEAFCPIDNDPFSTGRSQMFANLASIIRCTLPPGAGMNAYMKELGELIGGLKEATGSSCSLCVASQREFKRCDSETINYFYFMKRKRGFSSADYLDYYMNVHSSFGLRTNRITYKQNYVDAKASRELAVRAGVAPADFDSVSEMRFASVEGLFASNAIEALGREAAEDEERFVDRESSEMVCCEGLPALACA